MERSNINKLQVTTNGELNLGLKPIIGAGIVIDIIGCAIAAASYGLTGNPAATRLINKFRQSLDKLGSSVTFTATFYGELEALKIIDGTIKNDGKTTIGGKMGVTILLAVEIGGKFNKSSSNTIIDFKPAARLQGDSYFGGYLILNTDDKGRFYTQKVLKFSGVVISGEIEGEVGWWKSNFKLEEKVLESSEYYFDKTYF
ncbi:hypothetical protein V3470_13890 [Flavobacterium oreochromis]|uniref:Uncharacterized protein n=1 Tax=Flavobacterium oreochromis TaxID=2906078 RepID=A0ABW8P8E5_9FLAO|nr:hypothetical protein [Flavobacterium oreochromis]OWP74776.1 hypothetical protein BWG23_13045 [Flavobacterium oreochromis]